MTNEQPTALDLADELEQTPFQSTRYEAAAMLRRQHATLQQALEALEWYGANYWRPEATDNTIAAIKERLK